MRPRRKVVKRGGRWYVGYPPFGFRIAWHYIPCDSYTHAQEVAQRMIIGGSGLTIAGPHRYWESRRHPWNR